MIRLWQLLNTLAVLWKGLQKWWMQKQRRLAARTLILLRRTVLTVQMQEAFIRLPQEIWLWSWAMLWKIKHFFISHRPGIILFLILQENVSFLSIMQMHFLIWLRTPFQEKQVLQEMRVIVMWQPVKMRKENLLFPFLAAAGRIIRHINGKMPWNCWNMAKQIFTRKPIGRSQRFQLYQ